VAPQDTHPDEEAFACFSEGMLSEADDEALIAHLLACEECAETFGVSLNMAQDRDSLLEIALKVKDKILEIVNTTGDVLVGQELIPAPILRSRAIKDFKDEITILKDFKDLRVQIKVENKLSQSFNLVIMVKQKNTQKVLKDLRISLLKDDLELESSLSDTGSVVFEHVVLGKYTVEIANLEERIASVLLDIQV